MTNDKPKAKPFNFEYDATTGIYIVAALREKAKAELLEASQMEDANFSGDPLAETGFYDMKAMHAHNRAKLLMDAADEIHKTVHEELVRNFDAAFERLGE